LGFALRLAAIRADRDCANVLVMDEAFKYVSDGYRDSLRDLLNALAEKMGIQIIQVTHIEQLIIGKVIEV
jgi:ABC-type nitrate/sulfonate/bicarbonate transport system ATPase subunit